MFDPSEYASREATIVTENVDVTMSMDEVRRFFEGEELEALETELDNAQGEIHSGKRDEVYVIIKVTR